MSLSGIQNGVQTSAEFYSLQFSSSQTNGCDGNRGIKFNEQQLQDILNRLNQALNPGGNCEGNTPSEAGSTDCNEGSNPIKDLLEKISNLIKSFLDKTNGGNNQTPQTGGTENGGNNSPITINNFNEAPKESGNFLEKLLMAPLEMGKSLLGGIFGGGENGGGGGLFGNLLGGIFGGK